MTEPDHERCPRCLFQRRACLCASIPAIANRTHVVIVRHHLERFRSSNTGRLAALALGSCEIVEHGGTAGIAKLPALDGACLVYPLGESSVPAPPPKQIVVLDATWSQARRMYRKLAALRGLPIWRLPAAAMPPRLREAPAAGFVSTIEAIAGALQVLEGDAIATPLVELFRLAVDHAEMTGRIGLR